jgi:hypothetical protein
MPASAGVIALLLLGTAFDGNSAPVSNIKSDQEVIFFPTIGYRTGADSWELEIQGCVYEPEKRRAALALIHEALDFKKVQLTEAQSALLAARSRLFMVDHERGKTIVVRFGGRDYKVARSRPDGRFSALIRVSDADLKEPAAPVLLLEAVLPATDLRRFAGEINLLGESGTVVISDIDDTIKITQIRDHKAVLRNTFLEPFTAVPGMAEVYRGWAKDAGAQFCYVSASPWQLLQPLNDFVRSNGFPAGAFYLKNFRWKDRSVLSLFQNPEQYKPDLIEPLLKRFPKRQFVLVGDSGERDPEIYAALARRYPDQVTRVLIRDVNQADTNRYAQAFRGVSPEVLTVFRDPAQIAGALRPGL